MLEDVRYYLMITRIVKKKTKLDKWKTPVGPRILKIIETNTILWRHCMVTLAGELTFQVRNMKTRDQFEMDLQAAQCSFCKYQLTGIPCEHAIMCIRERRLDILNFVDHCYKEEALLKAYTPIINSTTIIFGQIQSNALSTNHQILNYQDVLKNTGREILMS